METTKIALFKGKKIRKTLYKNEWWFSILDVIFILAETPTPKTYWAKMKTRDKEISQPFPFWEQLKMCAEDGKQRYTDCADTEGIFRIIQSIPYIIYNKEKNIGEKEKKATDMLDFIISMGAEEFRVSEGDEDSVKRAIKIILESYGDKDIIRLVKSYIKRGRLTLLGDKNSQAVDIPKDSFTTKNRAIFTKHNEARVVNNKDLESLLKDISLEVCEEMTRNDSNN